MLCRISSDKMFIGLSRPSLGCMHIASMMMIAMARFPRPDETSISSWLSLIQTALARKVMCVLEWVAIYLGRSGLLSLPFPYTK